MRTTTEKLNDAMDRDARGVWAGTVAYLETVRLYRARRPGEGEAAYNETRWRHAVQAHDFVRRAMR